MKHAKTFDAIRHHVTEPEWELMIPLIEEIRALKRERDALVLAHNYQRVEVFHGVADVTGDSLALAIAAAKADHPMLVVCGVQFMAETAKILNPSKRVLIPDNQAGCTLADSLTVADVEYLRSRHPGCPIVVYVNTSAAVKAAADVCCTSSNAAEVVASLGAREVVLAPDCHLAHYVQRATGVKVHTWNGRCSVHDVFTSSDIAELRETYPDVAVAAHPECRPEVQRAADFVGSTSELTQWLRNGRPPRAALITECTMADNLRKEFSDVEFVQPCSLCPNMRRVTLTRIRDALRHDRYEVDLDAGVMAGARRSLARMLGVNSSRRATA